MSHPIDPAPSGPSLAPLEPVLVVGAGGALGSALLAEALGGGRFASVSALTEAPLGSALRGLQPLPSAVLARRPPVPLEATTAFVVFERERHANGRDAAFTRPEPTELPALAAALRTRGVRRLVVVVPHVPALLPQALAHGFADETERAVAALGFEHLVFLRAAGHADGPRAASAIERFAAWWLSQLRWMVPDTQKPLGSAALAAVLVELARRLPLAPPGTRVIAQERLATAARARDPAAALAACLAPAATPSP